MSETLTHTVKAPIREAVDEKKQTELSIMAISMARKGSMGPPPVPSSSSPTAPRMTRLPSLQQITDRLHVPSPLSTHNPSTSNIDPIVPSTNTTTTATDTKQHETTPVKPKLAIDSAVPAAHGSPFTSSPSGRLKLPASAMTRSHSSSSANGSLPTVSKEVTPTKEEKEPLSFTDPFLEPSAARLAGSKSQSMSREPSRDGYIKGYKDVPSLDQIRQRVGSTVSIRGSISTSGALEDKPIKPQPIPELITPKDNGQLPSPPDSAASTATSASSGPSLGAKGSHPLAHSWTLYFDAKGFKPDPGHVAPRENGDGQLIEYEKSLVTVGRFDTVEGFARYLNNVRLPSQLAKNSNYHMFKNGVRPMWEDPANENGGKWVMHFRSAPHLLDHAWANLTMALIGEVLDPEDQMCGVVASSKPRTDRIQVWTRGKDDIKKINELGMRIVDVVGLEGREVESMSLEFQVNSSTHPPANTYLHIPFPSRSTSFHAPPTPSRLNVSVSPGLGPGHAHGLTHHPSLPQIPKSPLSPRSPLARQGELLAPPSSANLSGSAPVSRRPSAGAAFSGPMGGGIKVLSSPRRNSAQLATTEAK